MLDRLRRIADARGASYQDYGRSAIYERIERDWKALPDTDDDPPT